MSVREGVKSLNIELTTLITFYFKQKIIKVIQVDFTQTLSSAPLDFATTPQYLSPHHLCRPTINTNEMCDGKPAAR
jgi:hypothetical protein